MTYKAVRLKGGTVLLSPYVSWSGDFEADSRAWADVLNLTPHRRESLTWMQPGETIWKDTWGILEYDEPTRNQYGVVAP